MRERSRRPRRPPSWGLIALMVAVALAGTGVGLWATRVSAASGYRVGNVTTATVRKTLVVSGTATAVHQATAAFQVGGTVSAVDVSLNQQVTAGQTLASLDTTALEQSVAAAQSTLTAAEAKLSEDEAAQSSATTASTATSTTTTTTSPTVAPSGGGTGGTATLARAQQAVVTAQQAADTDATAAATALGKAQSACGGSGTGTATSSGTGGSGAGSGGTGGGTGGGRGGAGATGPGTGTGGPGTAAGPTTTTTTTTTGTAATSSSSGSSAGCTSALAAALAAQKQVSTDQKTVAQAETALAKLLTSSSSSSRTGGTTGSGAAGSGTTAASGTGTGSTSTHGSDPSTGAGSATASDYGSSGSGSSAAGTSTATVTAAQLATDQASIDKADASLIEAQQKLADAQLTSPISGTVASVGLSVGQAVTAGSSTDAVTIVNAGGFQASGSLTPAQSSEVKVGDSAEVTVTGAGGTLAGTVSRVGPVDTGSSGYTYPFVVALPAGSHGIAAGSAAQITVTLAEAEHARVVPTSAVHSSAGGSYVEALESGQEVRHPVQVGVVGAEYTQITSALPSATKVVLADLSTPVPASSSTSSANAFVGGALPGGGAFQVGFPAGGTFFHR